MNLTAVVEKAWKMLWNYKALWLFGIVLALVGANTIFPVPWNDWENNDQWTKIRINDTTIKVPGSDMTIDFNAPGGVRITTPDGITWQEFNDLVDELNLEASIDLWPILVELAVIVVVSILLGLIARYIAETAVIRMVYETEETGKRLSVWQGLQRGLTFRAGRLFLIDLVVGILLTVIFIGGFGVSLAPILLAIGRSEAVLITVGVGTLGLLVLAAYLWMAASGVLSLVVQTIKRALVLENQSFLASIRLGIMMTKNHLKEVSLVWLVWMGIRVLWVPLSIMAIILLFPVMIMSILGGVALGGVSATVVAAIANAFTTNTTSVIMGLLAGLPVFILVMVSPVLFVGGLVQTYLSSMWTITYHDLKTIEGPVQEPAPQAQVIPAGGSAD